MATDERPRETPVGMVTPITMTAETWARCVKGWMRPPQGANELIIYLVDEVRAQTNLVAYLQPKADALDSIGNMPIVACSGGNSIVEAVSTAMDKIGADEYRRGERARAGALAQCREERDALANHEVPLLTHELAEMKQSRDTIAGHWQAIADELPTTNGIDQTVTDKARVWVKRAREAEAGVARLRTAIEAIRDYCERHGDESAYTTWIAERDIGMRHVCREIMMRLEAK